MKYRIAAARDFCPAQEFEVSFYPLEQIKEWEPLKRDTRWNSSVREQWLKKNKALEPKAKSKSESLRVNFAEGGTVLQLFIDESISAFDLQKFLRKNLGDVFSSSLVQEVWLDLTWVSKNFQRDLLCLVASYGEVSPWKPPFFGTKKEKEKSKVPKTIVLKSTLGPSAIADVMERGTLLGGANNLIRTLADLPSNYLGPKEYRTKLKEFSLKNRVSLKYLGVPELKRLKAGAFLAVVQADAKTQSGIAHLKYSPRKKAGKTKKLCLVGKGVCFDTGGNNIKTGGYMNSMHRDMTGSAVALALMEVLVRMKVPYEVHAFLAISENLVSPSAYRPNDVVVACDGTSIEVVDTDAEGRMVLADTLALASREKPDLIVDFATLTGSAVRAVGTQRSAVFSNRESLLKEAFEAGERSGERNWGFPIDVEYAENIKSDYADLLQCSHTPGCDHINAATFLSRFVQDGIGWVHVDLSCEEHKGGLGLVSTNTTGYGVRWGLEFIENQFR